MLHFSKKNVVAVRWTRFLCHLKEVSGESFYETTRRIYSICILILCGIKQPYFHPLRHNSKRDCLRVYFLMLTQILTTNLRSNKSSSKQESKEKQKRTPGPAMYALFPLTPHSLKLEAILLAKLCEKSSDRPQIFKIISLGFQNYYMLGNAKPND